MRLHALTDRIEDERAGGTLTAEKFIEAVEGSGLALRIDFNDPEHSRTLPDDAALANIEGSLGRADGYTFDAKTLVEARDEINDGLRTETKEFIGSVLNDEKDPQDVSIWRNYHGTEEGPVGISVNENGESRTLVYDPQDNTAKMEYKCLYCYANGEPEIVNRTFETEVPNDVSVSGHVSMYETRENYGSAGHEEKAFYVFTRDDEGNHCRHEAFCEHINTEGHYSDFINVTSDKEFVQFLTEHGDAAEVASEDPECSSFHEFSELVESFEELGKEIEADCEDMEAGCGDTEADREEMEENSGIDLEGDGSAWENGADRGAVENEAVGDVADREEDQASAGDTDGRDDMSWLLDGAEPDVIRDTLEDPGDDDMVDEDGWDGTDAGTDEDEEDDYDDSWRVD